MRHEDHRFEMSRQEFCGWARSAAAQYGYDVLFTGVGSVQNAFQGQKRRRSVFPEADLDVSFGFSTQAAIFTRVSCPETNKTSATPFEQMTHVITHTYPYGTDDMYPPTSQLTAQLVLAAETLFRPPFQVETNYRDEDNSVQLIDCKEFFETCYAMRRVARFHFDVFLNSVETLMGQVLVPPNLDAGDSQARSQSSEPTATLLSAEVVIVDGWRTCIKYTYSISSFRNAADRDEEDSVSTISGDWDVAKDMEYPEVACWTHVEGSDAVDEAVYRDWQCIEQESMLFAL